MQLREVLADRGLSQQDAANKTRIDRAVINKYVNKRGRPNLGTLVKLADGLECSVDELLGRPVSASTMARIPLDLLLAEVARRAA